MRTPAAPEPAFRLKKKLGQNFLRDESVLEREAAFCQPKGKIALEIGAGDGRLTEKLLALSPKKLIAVEKDGRFAELLKEKFAQQGNLEIVNANFLDYVKGEGARKQRFDIIIGNVPYYISSPILFALKELDFELAVLCLQKEFAERMVAEKGTSEYSRLTVMSGIYFEVGLVEFVPRAAFEPQPKVDSAIIWLRPTGKRIDSFSEKIISSLFQHKRKSVRNAFADSSLAFSLSKQEARLLIEKVKNSERRVVSLGADELLALAEGLREIMGAK